ncbi:MAG: chorismate mutase [Oscillospiraceae bacterium]|jgi:chorismate mutase/prephenate dehydratase|nr:chorismate mutase [Oscillospiraceae bacterium]
MNLDELRNEIDNIDRQITHLFSERMELAKGVAEYKKIHNLPIMQGNREQEVLDKVVSEGNPQMADGIRALFMNIMDISKCLQQREIISESKEYKIFKPLPEDKIACQGLAGSNSERATQKLFPNNEIVFYKEFEDVFSAVENGECKYGFLAIDNTITGSIGLTYELLNSKDCKVTAMSEITIEHRLCSREHMDIKDIQGVYSHPQALSQCSDFLKSNGLKCVEWGNTATSAEYVANNQENIACICSPQAQEKYKLVCLNEHISNFPCNHTRFVCIAKDIELSEKANTVSIVIVLPHKPGSLYRLMTKLFTNNVNITKLESRPLADGSFNFKFYIDFEGNITNPHTVALLNEIEHHAEYYKFLGCF